MTSAARILLLRSISVMGLAVMVWQVLILTRDHGELIRYGFDQAASEIAVATMAGEIARAADFEPRVMARLAAGDLATAESYVALADEAGVPLSAELEAELARARSPWVRLPADANSFLRGFLFGHTDDFLQLGGAVISDLVLIGDLRDLGQAGAALARGEPVDETIVALSAIGVALSAGTLASAGGTAPAKFGASTIKRLLRAGRLSPAFAADLRRLASQALPKERLGMILGEILAIRPFAKSTPISRQVAASIERGAEPWAWRRLQAVGDDLESIRSAAGSDGLLALARHARNTDDLALMAQVTPVAGKRTLALEHTLGKSFMKLAKTSLKWSLRLWLELLSLLAAALTCVFSLLAQRPLKSIVRRV